MNLWTREALGVFPACRLPSIDRKGDVLWPLTSPPRPLGVITRLKVTLRILNLDTWAHLALSLDFSFLFSCRYRRKEEEVLAAAFCWTAGEGRGVVGWRCRIRFRRDVRRQAADFIDCSTRGIERLLNIDAGGQNKCVCVRGRCVWDYEAALHRCTCSSLVSWC